MAELNIMETAFPARPAFPDTAAPPTAKLDWHVGVILPAAARDDGGDHGGHAGGNGDGLDADGRDAGGHEAGADGAQGEASHANDESSDSGTDSNEDAHGADAGGGSDHGEGGDAMPDHEDELPISVLGSVLQDEPLGSEKSQEELETSKVHIPCWDSDEAKCIVDFDFDSVNVSVKARYARGLWDFGSIEVHPVSRRAAKHKVTIDEIAEYEPPRQVSVRLGGVRKLDKSAIALQGQSYEIAEVLRSVKWYFRRHTDHEVSIPYA